ncbi:hypothetical protein PIB30_069273 [Stylosanthes scabra]|uniref:Uncharacterized protein n=1 Tax=Stylosanthes scabra TaxID=79078 RepID=A0ABU6VLJ4_9FABA|nr:hypothetical protein [Stylosanthes scabra]
MVYRNLVVGVVRLYDFQNPWGGLKSYSMDMVLEDQWVIVFTALYRRHMLTSSGLVFVNMIILDMWLARKILKRRNKMRCTLFGELVGKVAPLLQNEDVRPLILVAQFFKPSVYLNEGYIQNTPHVSQVFINPDSKDIDAFKRSLLRDGEAASQPITHVESQFQYSASDEFSSGDYRIVTLEDVYSMTEVKYIILCSISRKLGARYRFNVILSDGIGCVTVVLWNEEAKLILGKTAAKIKQEDKGDKSVPYPSSLNSIVEKKFIFKLIVAKKNINGLDSVYSVFKICDDEMLIGIYSSQVSGLGNVLPVRYGETNEVQSILDVPGVTCLSKESIAESNLDEFFQTPVKWDDTKVMLNFATVTSLCSPEDKVSTNKTFKRGGGKRKYE